MDCAEDVPGATTELPNELPKPNSVMFRSCPAVTDQNGLPYALNDPRKEGKEETGDHDKHRPLAYHLTDIKMDNGERCSLKQIRKTLFA